MSTTEVSTRPCVACGKIGYLQVEVKKYRKWLTEGGPIQWYMPEMPAPLREQLISGTHPDCWIELFGEDEDMEED
jgi:hypothetical protein